MRMLSDKQETKMIKVKTQGRFRLTSMYGLVDGTAPT